MTYEDLDKQRTKAISNLIRSEDKKSGRRYG